MLQTQRYPDTVLLKTRSVLGACGGSCHVSVWLGHEAPATGSDIILGVSEGVWG